MTVALGTITKRLPIKLHRVQHGPGSGPRSSADPCLRVRFWSGFWPGSIESVPIPAGLGPASNDSNQELYRTFSGNSFPQGKMTHDNRYGL